MRIRRSLWLVVASVLLAAACGDDGGSILDGGKHWLVQLHRLTQASDAPDQLEIEVEVLTGANLSRPAPDGTTVVFETTFGAFESGSALMEAQTLGGYSLAILELPAHRPASGKVTARVGEAATEFNIKVDQVGFLELQ